MKVNIPKSKPCFGAVDKHTEQKFQGRQGNQREGARDWEKADLTPESCLRITGSKRKISSLAKGEICIWKNSTELELGGGCREPDYQRICNIWADFTSLWAFPIASLLLSPSCPPSSLYKREIRFAFKSLKKRDFAH